MKFGALGTLKFTLGMTLRGFSSGWNWPTVKPTLSRLMRSQSPFGQRIELLGLLADAEVGVEDEVRADDLGVVHADAAVGVQVVGVEEAPLVRAGGDLAAALVRVPVLEREVEAVVRRRPPVDADDVVHLRVVGVLLRRVVELALREGAVEVVGARQHVEQRAAVRVDAVGGDDVAGEAAGSARRRRCRRLRRSGSLMLISRPWASSVCEKSPCISRVGRHRPVAQRSGTAHERRLDRVEEEELLLGFGHRAAEVGAVGVEAVARLLRVGAVGEEVGGVECLVRP